MDGRTMREETVDTGHDGYEDDHRHRVDPADEARHVPAGELLWNESYYLDFVTGDGRVGGYVRIGLCPNLGVTWWAAAIVGPDRPLVTSVAYDLPVADGTGLVIGAGGLDVRAEVVAPLVTMTVAATAPARTLAHPGAVYHGEPGTPTTLGLDLAWTTDGEAYHYDLTTRYEVPCLVHGEVSVGDDRIAVTGHGQRDHSWGERDWWAFGWCWAAFRLDDGTRVHVADIRIPGHPVAFGYLQPPRGGVTPVTTLEVTEALGPEGIPVRGRAVVGPGRLDLRIEPQAFGPLLLTAPDGRISRFPRGLARFVADDGRTGLGWIEWNQPDGRNRAQ
jgi:hypothetical protein